MIQINDKSDMLLIVDVQNDFITGSLAVKNAAEIIPVINSYIKKIPKRVFSRDMHPADHSSFKTQGGPWPSHCVVDTEGVRFHPDLMVDLDLIDKPPALMVYKGSIKTKDAYSAFDGTGLSTILAGLNTNRLFICGLATDYCVKATVLDALKVNKINMKVYLLVDAIKAVNVKPLDGKSAIRKMIEAGAVPITFENLE